MTLEKAVPLVLRLADDDATLARVGGKGAALAQLARAGLPVPPGFHITTDAYRRFVAANDLKAVIEAAVGEADSGRPATLERAAERIRVAFAAGALPDEVRGAIRAAYVALGDDQAVAVRSSATAEDLPELSFAGQQESYLNVRREAAVLDAARRCWASLWTAQAIGYRARQRIAPADVYLAVVVQELVAADAAGILFTADPLTGARDQVLINAAWGLGEAVVGGLVTPDRLTLDKATGAVLAEQIADKERMTVGAAEGTRTAPTPEAQRRQAVLTQAQAAELARLGTRIEQLFGRPVDVEWTLRDGAFAIVQARPITALPEPAGSTPAADWTLPDGRAPYVRGSVIELLPDPLSPLFATLALPEWNAAGVQLGRRLGLTLPGDILTTVNGYAYARFGGINLGLAEKVSLVAMVPRLARMLRQSRRRWQDEARPAYAAVVARWAAPAPAEMTAVRLLAGARELVAGAARHYLDIQTGVLMAAYLSEGAFAAAYDRLLKRPGDPSTPEFLLGYSSTPIQAEQSLYDLAAWVGEQPGLAAYLEQTPGNQAAALLGGPPPAPITEERWREFGRRWSDHLARFGHAIYDLDFVKVVPADDPAPLLETLKFFLRGQGADPAARQAASATRREAATLALRGKRRSPRRLLVQRLLPPAQRFAPLREDALGDVGLGWPLLRRLLAEVGRRLVAAGSIDQADDTYWLTADELHIAAAALDAGRSLEPAYALVAERRARWAAQRRVTPPISLPVREGAAAAGTAMSMWMPAKAAPADGDTIRGIGAGPGRVVGTARVLHGPEDFGRMQVGDILVARITTPAWTPLFALAAGVVTDVGGPLSHSSIVAREYHIPAVLGTGVATERLQSGQRIVVDGDAGTVAAYP